MNSLKISFLILLLQTVTIAGYLQIDSELRFQKEHNGYWFNGVSFGMAHSKIWNQKVRLQFNYNSSRLGTAMLSNAIDEDKYGLDLGLHFRPYTYFEPLVNLALGIHHTDTEGFDVYGDYASNTAFYYGLAFGFKVPLFKRWGGPVTRMEFIINDRKGMVSPLSWGLSWSLPVWPGVIP